MTLTRIIIGDVRDALATLPAGSFDAVFSDPPYGLSFMGKAWDHDVPGPEVWAACRAACKPGAPLMAFGGTRTWHWLAVGIEQAGWDIRDTLMWLYGSGFPKSLDVSKAIDKALGAERERAAPRSVIAHQRKIGNRRPYMDDPNHTTVSDIPASASASAWSGYGTALKPAWEPVILARAPLDGTVAASALAHGVGGINVDGCRIAGDEDGSRNRPASKLGSATSYAQDEWTRNAVVERRDTTGLGRWPANVLLDEEAAAALDTQSGTLTSGAPCGIKAGGQGNAFGHFGGGIPVTGIGDTGGASRFFYTAKAGAADRTHGNTHPTVKPSDLTGYLAKLILPPAHADSSPRRLLVPFCGSGGEIVGALNAGWEEVVGIEISPEYAAMAVDRINASVGTLFNRVTVEPLGKVPA